jgi:thiol-disulfide isomerase/thioredoxin
VAVQVFCYPEDAVLTGPDRLCALAAGLGADAVAVAVRYHPARRWFARHGVVRHSPPGITYFRPEEERYGRLRPRTVAGAEEIDALRSLREEAPRHGLAFHAWTVVLHDDPVVAAHPDLAARTLDGTPTIHALCPSHPDVVEYAAALTADVCARFSPDVIELESALYAAWDPSYVVSLELDPPAGMARAMAGQCFCGACVRLMEELDHDPEELRAHALAGTGAAVLRRVRAHGVRRVMEATTAAAHEHGVAVRPLIFDDPDMAALQGSGPDAFAPVDRVGVGCGTLTGQDLAARYGGLSALAGDRPLLASLNWSPDRTGDRLADDVRALMGVGAADIALYNLSLVPERALPDLAAAAAAAKGA